MRSFAFCLTCLLLAAPAMAAPEDAEIRKALIGGWNSAPLANRTPDNMLQIFRDDGTSSAYFFKDASCTTVLSRIDVNWEVSEGVLTFSYAQGHRDHNRVVSIDAGKLSMLSLDLDRPIERVRATTCREPAK